ncbi:MAG TPA: HlyD family secretion protein [Planctomycetaceae bacterium]|nr:HlyD family secretion protein [Planctomycetaceae bacterium]
MSVLAVVVIALLARWVIFRATASITDDAFIEAHIVNVAPQAVSGRLVRCLVDENDHVEQGQLLAEIDPVTYRDQVELARSKVDGAEAELRRQQAALERLKLEVPIQIEISRRSLAAAHADQGRAKEALKLTIDSVEKGVEEAQAGLAAAKADLVLADQEYTRFSTLYKQDAVPLRRSQEVTRSRDAAEAQRRLAAAKLAKAEAERTQIEVAKRTLEAAEKSAQKAAGGVDLAETGNAQIREVELLTALKKENVTEARRALTSAEDQLKYTQIRAPFPGIIVKRYRHLGDFGSAGVPILSMYNPDLMYVTAHLEETRLRGVAPGNAVDLEIDAFGEPFRGRVVWIDKSTGAQFALLPRNVVSGEFTKVVQRVPVRIQIEKDDRWPNLRSGLSVRATISHGAGDPEWAKHAAAEMSDLETRFNRTEAGPNASAESAAGR